MENIKKSSLFQDKPPVKANKGTGPLGRLFSPSTKKAKKATAKREGVLLVMEAAYIKKRVGSMTALPLKAHFRPTYPQVLYVDASLVLWHINGTPLAMRLSNYYSAATAGMPGLDGQAQHGSTKHPEKVPLQQRQPCVEAGPVGHTSLQQLHNHQNSTGVSCPPSLCRCL